MGLMYTNHVVVKLCLPSLVPRPSHHPGFDLLQYGNKAMFTLWSYCERLTPLLTPTVDTTYCDVVLIACHEASQFMLCDTGSGDVQKSPVWSLRSIGGNVDEVEISTVSTTQSPAHNDIHSSTDICREANTREGSDDGGT